jgi:hypothetical protein
MSFLTHRTLLHTLKIANELLGFDGFLVSSQIVPTLKIIRELAGFRPITNS